MKPPNSIGGKEATSSAKNSLGVVIAAAGMSHRLGQPKALLRREGQPLVIHTIILAKKLMPLDCITVIGNILLPWVSAIESYGSRWAHHDRADLGMMHSLQLGLKHLSADCDHVLFLTVDQIHQDIHHLELLWQSYSLHANKPMASQYQETLGIPAIFPRQFLEKPFCRADSGFKALLRSSHAQCITNEQLDFDIDTPSDLNHAIEHGWLDPLL